MKKHQNHTKTFEELTFKEKDLSLNAQEINLERQCQVHYDSVDSESQKNVKDKLIKSAQKLLNFANNL